MDEIKKEYIRGTAQFERFGDEAKEPRVRWFGHVQRRVWACWTKDAPKMELPGKRRRRRKLREKIQIWSEALV